MFDLEIWIRLVATYGPFALIILFIFVVEKKTRVAWQEAAEQHGRVPLVAVYCGTWLVVFGLVGFASYAWYEANFRSESTIQGRIKNLQGSETITSRSAPLFLRRVYGPKGMFDYKWRLITKDKLPDSSTISFTFDRSKPDSEFVTDHMLTIRSAFYDNPVQISYDRRTKKLYLVSGLTREELPQVDATVALQRKLKSGIFVANAYAQEIFLKRGYITRLESNDPIIRREARKEIAEFGKDALPWLQNTLATPNGNYRVVLGLIITLNKMGDIADLRKNPAALATIARATIHRDPTLSRQARLYVEQHPSWEIADALGKERRRLSANTKPVLANAPPNDAFKRLVRFEFDTFYKTGLSKIEAYVSAGRVQPRTIDNSIAAFRKAWALRLNVARDKRVYYLQALYGWGRALHERSLKASGRRDPARVDAARKKFGQFLRELGKLPNRNEYPEPAHIRGATAYLKKPVSSSLK